MSVLLRVLVLGMRTKFAGALRTRRWGRKTPRIDVEVCLLSAMNSRSAVRSGVLSSAFAVCRRRKAAATDKGERLAGVQHYTVRERLGLAARERLVSQAFITSATEMDGCHADVDSVL